ncbi:hypothetical protein EB118_08145 [bacterium]|nr:hypothetical protein [bacterium]
MMNDQFYEGLEVYYHEQLGTIRFICSEYVTVCIKQGEDKLNDICILVYPHQYGDIKIEKQSQK